MTYLFRVDWGRIPLILVLVLSRSSVSWCYFYVSSVYLAVEPEANGEWAHRFLERRSCSPCIIVSNPTRKCPVLQH